MRLTQILAISFLVVLLSSGTESYRIHKRDAEEEHGILSKVRGFLDSAMSSIRSAAETVYEKVKETGVPDKAMSLYDQAAGQASVYANILADQVYHLTRND